MKLKLWLVRKNGHFEDAGTKEGLRREELSDTGGHREETDERSGDGKEAQGKGRVKEEEEGEEGRVEEAQHRRLLRDEGWWVQAGEGVSASPTLGWIGEDAVASALDDGRLGGILIVVGGAAGFGGGVLGGGFGGAVSALAWVGAPVVVALALLLQGEPARDVVQLSGVG